VTTSERLRLFVAADVPEGHRADVAEWVATWRDERWGGRWLPPASQHVTLKFLGTTARERLEEAADAVATVARAHERAEVALDGLGGFPSLRRTRVLWLGVEDPSELLTRLAGALDDALAPLGSTAEKRRFTPHLTLARFPAPRRLETIPEQAPALAPFEVSEAVLYRSHLHPRGACYEPLASFPLDPRR
jgi:2'-5' RNA ligase